MKAQDPLEIISSTADAAFATDEEGRIVIWNRAAERILGYDASEVLGRPCHEILRGADVFGNRFCDESCSLVCMTRRHEAMHHFEIDLEKSSGETLRAAFSVVMVPGPRTSQFTLVHIFQPASRGRDVDDLIRRILAGSPAPEAPAVADLSAPSEKMQVPLTSREIEVLRLLADGRSTRKIADSLFISTITVRNHIQHILNKLDAHSKLEAVSFALRQRLI